MTSPADSSAHHDTAATAVAPPPESWVAGRFFRLIAAVLGLLLLAAAMLPLMTGGNEVAGALLRIGDAQLILAILGVTIAAVNVLGVLRLGTAWVRPLTVLLGLCVVLWAAALLMEISEIGIPEPLGGAQPGAGLWLALVLGVAVTAAGVLDRGSLSYGDALLDRMAVRAEKGRVLGPARLCRTSLRIALRRLGPDHPYTMYVAACYGILLAHAGHGDRARRISDQLYPRHSALGTENTDPQFSRLRFELSRKGL